jgi:hypothetical protein
VVPKSYDSAPDAEQLPPRWQMLVDYIGQDHAGESGIVYCLSR